MADNIDLKKVPNLIIDTDLGCDCDDAGAIAIANLLHNEGKANILCVTHCLNDDEGARCIDYINNYFGNDFEVGKSYDCAFDATNYMQRYVYKLSNSFNRNKKVENSVELIKRKLAKVADKSVTMVFIGQLNNLAGLIKDEVGKKLIYDKVKQIFIMAGNFEPYDEYFTYRTSKFKAEFNVNIDIPSAITVAKEINLPLRFIDFNQGIKVFTGEVIKGLDNPVSKIYELFGVVNRESWDLLTTICVGDGIALFNQSPNGKVLVSETGKTTFEEGVGNHQILTIKDADKATKYINETLIKIKE